jgi:hypothetical protein
VVGIADLDPYLPMSMSAELPTGALAACLCVRFAVCDHLLPRDFLLEEYKHLTQAINRENVEMLSVPAVEVADFLPMRNILVLNQIATIATARHHGCMFASDCCTFRRAATTVLKPAHILSGRQVRQRFNLNQP